MANEPCCILVVDDDKLFREGRTALLNAGPNGRYG